VAVQWSYRPNPLTSKVVERPSSLNPEFIYLFAIWLFTKLEFKSDVAHMCLFLIRKRSDIQTVDKKALKVIQGVTEKVFTIKVNDSYYLQVQTTVHH
jgi:hypothetical protein